MCRKCDSTKATTSLNMEKKAKIIATLGPAIYSSSKLKKIIEFGVDAFRINFSHNTKDIKSIINKIRNLEQKTKKKLL